MTNWRSIVQALDRGPFEVTTWEANVLESLLRTTQEPTRSQRELLVGMARKYLRQSQMSREVDA